jgi:ribosomal protein L37AE/L43A|tara:strand:- start:461 stop:598 length:138 start_codon:yes stop_codon:yes gene_type:complete
MKKLKDLYRKLVDKIFGKRCECLIKKREMATIITCVTCGKVLNNG